MPLETSLLDIFSPKKGSKCVLLQSGGSQYCESQKSLCQPLLFEQLRSAQNPRSTGFSCLMIRSIIWMLQSTLVSVCKYQPLSSQEPTWINKPKHKYHLKLQTQHSQPHLNPPWTHNTPPGCFATARSALATCCSTCCNEGFTAKAPRKSWIAS